MQYTKKLYNILAYILRKIKNITDERNFEHLRTVKPEYEIEITERLKRRFPDMFNKYTRNVAEISEWRLANSALLYDLGKYLESSEDIEELIFLVKNLDLYLEDSFYECIPIDQETYTFICLNDNYKECDIFLLPRVVCGWEHENRDAYTSYTIFYYLRNFYYLTQADIINYQVENILMSKELLWEAVERRELRIMVSPVTGEKAVEITEPYTKSGSQFTAVKSIRSETENRIKEKALNILKQAAAEEADILVFPEMLGTEAIAESIMLELENRETIVDNKFPALTMCPTIWKDHVNYCRVLNDTGEMICEQQKHHGVDLSDHIWNDLKEDLRGASARDHYVKEDIRSDQKIYVLHCYGIGRIAVVICKDFIITGYLKIIVEKLRISLVIVPSFTCNDYQFKLIMPKYAELDCNIVWLNTCSARWLSKAGEMKADVTSAFLSGKGGVDAQQKGMKDFCGKQCKCEEECIHTYRISLDMEEKE